MSRIVSFLKDPIHVARFQDLCGVPYKAGELRRKQSLTGSPKTKSNGTKTNGPISNGLAHRNKTPTTNSTHESSQESAKLIRGHLFFDLLFRFSSGLGGEVFYITFLPFLVWDVDFYVARRIIYLWTLVMYTGQALKDVLKMPRPPPPVKRLETWFDNEYGFPSTHAIVATTIPYGCWVLMIFSGRYDFSFFVSFVIATIWCVLVCLSRLYLGVHNILDLLAGCSVAITFLVAGTFFLDPMDDFIVNYQFSPIVVAVICIILMAMYPQQEADKWCPARGDTGKVVGVGLGVAWSARYVSDKLSVPNAGTPFPVMWPSPMICATCALRWFLGCLLLALVRFVMKEVALKGLPFVIPYDTSRPWKEQAWMEVSVRLLTYGAIGFSVMLLAPGLFELSGKAVGWDLSLKSL